MRYSTAKILIFTVLLIIAACHPDDGNYKGFNPSGEAPSPVNSVQTPQDDDDTKPILSDDAKLALITLSVATLDTEFSADILNYTANVEHSVNSITVQVDVSHVEAKLWVNGIAMESGRNFRIPLQAGNTVLTFLVIAEDGTQKQYVLTILRAADDSIGTSTAVAIPMKYHVKANRQKFIALSAYSDNITYRQAVFSDVPIDFGIRYRNAITQWLVQSAPNNGTLYDGYEEINSLPHNISDPDELLYVPDTDYVGADSFTFYVRDNQGSSQIGTIALIVESELSLPGGIAVFPAIYNAPQTSPATTGDTENIDWYINNAHPSATDSQRTEENEVRHGTPETPRLTFPPSDTIFEAGTNVYIAGGVQTPYTLSETWHRWVLAGTAINPVQIVGVNNGPNKPIIEHNGTELRLEAEYAVIEGLHFRGSPLQTNALDYTNGNVIMRHNIIDGLNLGTTGAVLRLNHGNNKILYDMHIKNGGRVEANLSAKNSVHGVQISDVEDYWIIDSLLHDHAGDSIQIDGEFAGNFYVARNKIHSDNASALSFKRRQDFMFMENDVWDYRAMTYETSGSSGIAITVGQEINSQTPSYSTIARNRIWDANTAIRYQGQYIWTTDNIIWNIHRNENNSTPKYAIEVGSNGEEDYYDLITNNTFHRVDAGIWLWADDNSNIKEHIYSGNIFGEFNPNSIEKVHYRISADHTASTVTQYNLYMTPLTIMWGTSDISSALDMATYRTDTSNAVASLDNTDPLFIDAGLFNLRLQTTSPAIGANIEQPVYEAFNTFYGRVINFDFDLNVRPVNENWDMGAFDQ